MFHTIWRHHRALFCGTIAECKQYLMNNQWLIDDYSLEPQFNNWGDWQNSMERINWVGTMTEMYCLHINYTPYSMGRGI